MTFTIPIDLLYVLGAISLGLGVIWCAVERSDWLAWKKEVERRHQVDLEWHRHNLSRLSTLEANTKASPKRSR